MQSTAMGNATAAAACLPAHLRPCKDPGDGAQVVHADTRLATRWPAAYVEVAQLALRRGCSEVADEVRVLKHNGPAASRGVSRQALSPSANTAACSIVF
jgi:hypothetical protein